MNLALVIHIVLCLYSRQPPGIATTHGKSKAKEAGYGELNRLYTTS